MVKKRVCALCLLSACVLMAGCSGLREHRNVFVAYGTAFRFFGLVIPRDDLESAVRRVPEGATIENVNASPADWESFSGVCRNLLSFTHTQIGGVTFGQ
ncbi:MAG: hypothetical protein JXP34_19215 [Planctomycetes bacterium]|nr:hypothetical protein [Planctomycetota bacterium]